MAVRGNPGSMTEQPETDERRDSIVVEGDDRDHVLPPTELDPYTPEPGTRPGAGTAFRSLWLALLVLAIVVAIVIVAALR